MSSSATEPVLDVRGLSVTYRTSAGLLKALRRLDLAVPPGSIVGIVGESGCGKSTLISAIIRLLAPNAQVDEGEVRFRGKDLLSVTPGAMRDLRGSAISVVFQDPMTSLNPVLTIGRQMSDIQYRLPGGRNERNARSAAMLQKVGIADAPTQLQRYPHQLSGGMKQRVAIAMALLAQPALMIADEPTTALDATLEVQIIRLLKTLQRDFGCSVLFISHHLGAIAELCDQVVVMYAGEVVERGPVAEVFDAPRHPYTQRLLTCDPARIHGRVQALPVIKGQLPDLVRLRPGCIFQERCELRVDRCAVEQPQLRTCGMHAAACHLQESPG